MSDELPVRRKQDLSIARRVAAVAFTNLLCWLPIGVLGFLAWGGSSLDSEAYAWMTVFVLPVNSALNPVLYSLPVIRDHLTKRVPRFMGSGRNDMAKFENDKHRTTKI